MSDAPPVDQEIVWLFSNTRTWIKFLGVVLDLASEAWLGLAWQSRSKAVYDERARLSEYPTLQIPQALPRRARLDPDHDSRQSNQDSINLELVAMRKIAIGSGLTILAAAAPVQAFEVPGVSAPAGVTEAGAVRLSEPAPGDAQPVIVKDKPDSVLTYENKLSNDIKPATPSAQIKQPGQTNRSKRRNRPQGYGKQD
jgi:hypothetical protein